MGLVVVLLARKLVKGEWRTSLSSSALPAQKEYEVRGDSCNAQRWPLDAFAHRDVDAQAIQFRSIGGAFGLFVGERLGPALGRAKALFQFFHA